jgi:zinc ribbon protein
MRKLLIVIALVLFVFPAGARAQQDLTLETAGVSVWPEYDRPTALVITEMLLSSDTALPAQVTLRVPTTVEKVQAVAVGSSFSTVTDQGIDYTLEPGDEWSEIKITALQRAIHVEYYDSALSKADTKRSYTYVWPGDYAVADFSFELRAPLQSNNVTSDPPLKKDLVDGDGFQYWTAQPGSLAAGQPYQVTFNYDRTTDLPSTASLVSATQQTGAVEPASSTTFIYERLPYIFGLLGLALLIGGGWWFWRSGREGSKTSPSRRRHVARGETDEEEIYCHNCGRRAEPTDRFCRACGTRLRQSDS